MNRILYLRYISLIAVAFSFLGAGFIAFDEDGSAWIANNYYWTPGTADPDGVACGAEDVL